MTIGLRFLLLGAVFGSAELRAELEWEQRRILLEPPAGAADAVGVFAYVNRGAAPVRVMEVRSGCGCTVTASEKEVIQPGEKGTIRAVFHVGSRQGRQSVAVTVLTSEPEQRTYDLAVDVELKDFANLAPRLLYWRVGEDPKPKQFQLTLAPGFRFVGAESTSTYFTVDVVKQEGGGVALQVVPKDAWAKRNGSIKVNVAQGEQPPIEVTAMVRVL